jgi:hypothetical protein
MPLIRQLVPAESGWRVVFPLEAPMDDELLKAPVERVCYTEPVAAWALVEREGVPAVEPVLRVADVGLGLLSEHAKEPLVILAPREELGDNEVADALREALRKHRYAREPR